MKEIGIFKITHTKRDFKKEQHLVRHFKYQKWPSYAPLLFKRTEIINPFLDWIISTNHENRLEFQLIVKPFYPLFFLWCKISFPTLFPNLKSITSFPFTVKTMVTQPTTPLSILLAKPEEIFILFINQFLLVRRPQITITNYFLFIFIIYSIIYFWGTLECLWWYILRHYIIPNTYSITLKHATNV